MTASEDDALAVVLVQLAVHGERIQQLSERADNTGTRLDALTTILGRHASVVNGLDGLDDQVAFLARQISDLASAHAAARDQAYTPELAPRWWHLTDAEREPALDRLRAWVEQIYQPGYGYLAAELPPCWELHPLCLYTLDWLSELWSVLYLSRERAASTLGAQAEWQTRLLPAAASQMARDATGCRHSPGSPAGHPPAAGPPPGHGHAPRTR